LLVVVLLVQAQDREVLVLAVVGLEDIFLPIHSLCLLEVIL
jgi:hypothetical protein